MAQAQAARRRGVNVFEEGKPMWQILLVFLVPLMLSNVLQSASQTMASIWIGRLISTQALGAVSAVFPIIFLLFSFVFGVSSGSSVLIGQAFGAHDHHKVKKIAGTVLGAALYLGIIVAIVGSLGSTTMLAWLATPPDIIAQADAYARVIFLTMPVFFVYFVYATILRGTGDSTTPFYALIVSAVLAIADHAALYRRRLRAAEARRRECGGRRPHRQRGGACVADLSTSHRHDHPLKFDRETLSDMRIDWSILDAVVRIGVPTGIQVMMVSLAEIAVISFVNRFGSSATAAYGAVNQVISYVQFPAISIGIAASIFGAQCIGARREDKLGSVIRSAVGLNYVVGGVIIGTLLHLRVGDPGVVHHRCEHAADRARAADDHALELSALRQFGGAQRRHARQRRGALADDQSASLRFGRVEVPAAYILMHHFGLNGVWIGYPIAYCVGLVLQFCYYEFVWKRKTHERLV